MNCCRGCARIAHPSPITRNPPQILSGKLHFTRCLSTKSMFPHVIKIAKVLGPKGLMPSPGKGTVSEDVAGMMATLSASTPFISDGAGRIQVEIGRLSWDSKQLYGRDLEVADMCTGADSRVTLAGTSCCGDSFHASRPFRHHPSQTT